MDSSNFTARHGGLCSPLAPRPWLRPRPFLAGARGAGRGARGAGRPGLAAEDVPDDPDDDAPEGPRHEGAREAQPRGDGRAREEVF